ncbi:MAG: SusD/RagB family nutrient-binding outer membrane lipoprotein [Phocaeicola sp.]
MKKYNHLIAAVALSAAALTTTSCRDEFADLNTNPSQVTTANPSYLFAQGALEFQPYDYAYWFYDAPMLYNWSQLAVPTNSMTENVNVTTATGGVDVIRTLKYLREIEFVRSQMSAEDAAAHAQTEAATKMMSIYLGLSASDINGDITYTEAAKALHGGTITPKFDRVADLYTLWLDELDQAISVFTTASGQQFSANQDIVYRGDVAKWAKLANSMKLKIAVRLLSQDKEKALEIAQEVVNAACGYIDQLADAMLFNKSAANSVGDQNYIYNWNDDVMLSNAASERFVNYMVDNLDPRVRFCYQKNNWNSKIVQAFYDQGKEIPHFVEENVNYTIDGSGKKIFVSWKGAGEPWVRYYGLPLAYNANLDQANYGDWFDYSNKFRLQEVGGATVKTYLPYSMFNYQMQRGRATFSVPTIPGGPVIPERNVDRPWYGLYMGAGEVNLYLAEFALLGASLEKTASAYYERGLEMSVREYDKLAEKNQIAYYNNTYSYDEHEATIELKAGEIEVMLNSADYQLTGTQAEQLEKVYLQQLIHFTMYPYEHFVTARRSGLPKFNSTLVAREDYTANNVEVTKIPRRFHTGVPNETSLMYPIQIAAYQAQGYTMTPQGSTNTTILNTERTWQDKNAPQWGAGPSM